MRDAVAKPDVGSVYRANGGNGNSRSIKGR